MPLARSKGFLPTFNEPSLLAMISHLSRNLVDPTDWHPQKNPGKHTANS